MRAFLLAGALALAGCTTTPVKLDVTVSRAVLTGDAAYIAAYQIGVVAVRTGKLSPEAFRAYEADAYNAILLLRTARSLTQVAAAQAQLTSAINKMGAY